MSKRSASYGTSILLALVPLAVAWFGGYWLYTEYGIGRHRSLYDSLRSDEALFEATRERADATAVDAASAPVRWTGDDERRSNLFLLGSSPSGRGVLTERATALYEGLGVNVYSLWNFKRPQDRYVDALLMLDEVTDVDVVAVELNYTFASDFALGFREQLTEAGDAWNPSFPVYDEEILAAEQALGFPDAVAGTPEQYRRNYEVLERRVRRLRRSPHGGEDPHPEGRAFEAKEAGASSSPLLATQNVTSFVLRRLRRLCAERGIGLVVYVPPRLAPFAYHVPPSAGGEARGRIDPGSYARETLRFLAHTLDLTVLDYDAFFDAREWFVDDLHLNARGARRFSDHLFGQLSAWLDAQGEPTGYRSFESSESD